MKKKELEEKIKKMEKIIQDLPSVLEELKDKILSLDETVEFLSHNNMDEVFISVGGIVKYLYLGELHTNRVFYGMALASVIENRFNSAIIKVVYETNTVYLKLDKEKNVFVDVTELYYIPDDTKTVDEMCFEMAEKEKYEEKNNKGGKK